MGIWEILFWLWLISFIISFILIKTVAKDAGFDAGDDAKYGYGGMFIFGPLALGGLIFAIIKDAQYEREYEEEERLRELKAKERKAAAKNKSIKRYPELLLNLEKQWKSYEASGDIPSQKFIKDVNTLGKDACSIPKENVENKDVLLEILRYGRINIYNIFEGDALKQGEKLAKSLGSSLKKISK